jgi:hypothetical protein
MSTVTTTSTTARPVDAGAAEPVGHRLKPNSLGFIGVAFFVIASAAPMAAFVGASPVLFSILGPGVPLVYVLVGLPEDEPTHHERGRVRGVHLARPRPQTPPRAPPASSSSPTSRCRSASGRSSACSRSSSSTRGSASTCRCGSG